MRTDEEIGFAALAWPVRGPWREAVGWYNPEDLDEPFDGIGPALEEQLHEVDPLTEALLDEGGIFDDEDGFIVEWALSQETRRPVAF